MTTITFEQAREKVVLCYDDTVNDIQKMDLTEAEFCKMYTIGYWGSGNSFYDFVDMFWDLKMSITGLNDLAFKSFDDIARNFVELKFDNEEDIGVNHTIQLFHQIRAEASSTIVG